MAVDTTKPIGSVKLVCGANTQEAAVAGRTVNDIRRDFGEVLNIPPDAQAIISGDNVQGVYVLRSGDTLEFLKPSGTKG